MSTKRLLGVFLFTWLAISSLMSLWSLATPLSASPDEPAHLVKAASVVRGEWVGEAGESGNVVHVPAYVAEAHDQLCYIRDSSKSAACLEPVTEGDELVRAPTTAGLYNPIYYLAVGWPSLVWGDVSGVYAMRVMSAIISGMFFAMAATLIASWRRPALPLLSLGVLATPMLLFLGGVVNPNAVETTAVLAVATGMLTLVLHRETLPFRWPALVVLVAGAFAVNTRGFSPVWVLFALVTPLILLNGRGLLNLFRQRWTIITAVAVAIATALAGAWTLLSGTLTAATGDGPARWLYPGVGEPFYRGFAWMIDRTAGFASQMIGLFGWMDTVAPAMTSLVWGSLIGSVLIAAVVTLRGRSSATFWIQLGGLVLLPALIQGAYVTSGGYIWQGRYALPLFVVLIVTTAATLAATETRLPPRVLSRLSVITWTMLVIGHFWAFAEAMRRYATGLDVWWDGLLRTPEWQPPGGALLILGLYLLALLLIAVVAIRHLRGPDDVGQPPPHAPASAHASAA